MPAIFPMLLSEITPTHTMPFPSWLWRMMSVRLRPSACRTSRSDCALENLDPHALKDIGLTRGDMPAVRSGVYFSDHTRRQR